MSRKTQKDKIVAALVARGYQALRYDPMFDVWQGYAIGNKAKRRVDTPGSKIWFGDYGQIRMGRTLGMAKPMPQAMRKNLAQEGEIVLNRVANSLADLGL